MNPTSPKLGLSACIVLAVAFSTAQAQPTAVSFKNQVLPIFQAHCNMCHGAGGVGNIAISLDLTSYKELRMGSAAGVAVIPYHPERSPLMRTLRENWALKDINVLRMPPLGPQLSTEDLETIDQWIKEGAKDN